MQMQPIPTRALSHARGLSMRTHLTAVCQSSRSLPQARKIVGSGDENGGEQGRMTCAHVQAVRARAIARGLSTTTTLMKMAEFSKLLV